MEEKYDELKDKAKDTIDNVDDKFHEEVGRHKERKDLSQENRDAIEDKETGLL